MWYNLTMNRLIEFDSGMKLVFRQNPSVRSTSLGVFVRAGSAYETDEQSGVSHFIEHMLFKGTSNRTAFDIVNETDSIGAALNAYTAKDHTCFYSTSLSDHAEKCMDVISDMYFNPKFDIGDIRSERKVVIEEINESSDEPSDLCFERLGFAAYKGHPLSKAILGTKKTLMKMKSDDLFSYLKNRYTPVNTALSICGNLTEKEAVSLADKYFEKKFTDCGNLEKDVIETAVREGRSVSSKKDISQAHIGMAFPADLEDEKRRYCSQILASVFSSEMSSRLFQSIREKLGLCYTVTGYPSAYENNGSYVIYTASNPQSAELAVSAIKKEVDILMDKGITDDELKKGKEQRKTSVVLGQESTSGLMRTMGSVCIKKGKLYDIDATLKLIDSVTREDVLNLARKIFDTDKFAVSTVSKDVSLDLRKVYLKN